MLVFEVQAIAKAYVMEGIEDAIRSAQEEDDDED
jgi:hypothetical protein